MSEVRDYQAEAVRAMLAHGFLPDEEQQCWTKTGKTHYVCGSMDLVQSSLLTLTMHRAGSEEVILSTSIDLSAFDEQMLNQALKPFDGI